MSQTKICLCTSPKTGINPPTGGYKTIKEAYEAFNAMIKGKNYVWLDGPHLIKTNTKFNIIAWHE